MENRSIKKDEVGIKTIFCSITEICRIYFEYLIVDVCICVFKCLENASLDGSKFVKQWNKLRCNVFFNFLQTLKFKELVSSEDSCIRREIIAGRTNPFFFL